MKIKSCSKERERRNPNYHLVNEDSELISFLLENMCKYARGEKVIQPSKRFYPSHSEKMLFAQMIKDMLPQIKLELADYSEEKRKPRAQLLAIGYVNYYVNRYNH